MRTSELSPLAGRVGWLVALTLLAARGGPALAQTEDSVPDGLRLGPMLVAPSLTSGYTYDSNVFLLNDAYGPDAQGIQSVQPALALSLPFRNSLFQIADTYRWMYYEKSPGLQGVTSNIATASLKLNFSSRDALILDATHTGGVSETIGFDPGGEAVFRGVPYRYHHEGIKVAREVYGERGYRIEVSRSTVSFDPHTGAAFFNYSGFDGEAAALVPVASAMNLSFGYLGSRYDHFDVRPGADPYAVFRKEKGDTIYAGIEGALGPRQTFTVRLGWETLDFPLGTGSNFHGVVGSATFNVVGGAGVVAGLTAVRQPYRSFYEPNNYYLFDAVSTEIRRRLPRGGEFGGRLTVSRLTYPDPIATGGLPAEAYRRDLNYLLEAYANLAVLDHVFFRIGLRRSVRSSDFPLGDFQGTGVFGGFVLGWM